MHKKPLISAIVTVFVMSVIFWYSLVFGNTSNYSGPIAVDFQLSKTIYPDSNKLSTNIFIFASPIDISQASLVSSCGNYSQFVQKRNQYYIFNVKYFESCNSKTLDLLHQGEKLLTVEQNILGEYDLWNKFVDYPTRDLEKALLAIDKRMLLNSQQSQKLSWFTAAKNTRQLQELSFIYGILNNILEKRSQKYKIPVEWYDLPTKLSKIPNAGRPYRAAYTDGIHHGWDVGSQLWEEVIALDDAMIVRVVSGFRFEDLNRLMYGDNLTEDQKIKNLDTLRWNQVWLKTAKWDVVFYSHLRDIFPNIEEWVMVRKWQKIGTIGISGVPDKNYTDYHLHFPIHKNPYNTQKAWKYDYDDYMRWPWYFQWKSLNDVLRLQYQVFEK